MGQNSKEITFEDDELRVPDHPKIPYFPGDGIGKEVFAVAKPVLDAAVETAYVGRRRIDWIELKAGQDALKSGLPLLPDETVESIKKHRVAIKGPTMTPVGGGHRSINVTLRQALDLYSNVRPIRYFKGVSAPVTDPGALDVVIFRENTEDVYAGIEFAAGSDGANRVESLLKELDCNVPPGSGIGVKVISKARTQRLMRAAIDYAIANNRARVTMMHKGNIMKETEGAFRRWGYELAADEYQGRVVASQDLGPFEQLKPGTVIIDDVIADAMFQELLIKPSKFDVIAAPNLNGDYVSDACAAQVGGLGIAPGANIGRGIAVFEATHGTAPDIAGKGIANPGSVILSGALLLNFIGWNEAAKLIEEGFASVLSSGRMTIDLAAGRDEIKVLRTIAFGEAVVKQICS